MLISLSVVIEPLGGYATESVMRGQCDTRPTVTLLAKQDYLSPLVGTWLRGLVFRALVSQLDGCKFDSLPPRCRVTTLGKLFAPTCLCRSQWSSGSMHECGV